MRVRVVLLRKDGTKLPTEKLRQSQGIVGELFVSPVRAVLCGGSYPGGWPEAGHIIPPLYEPRLRVLRGEDFVIVGMNLRDAVTLHWSHPQSWWCRPSA